MIRVLIALLIALLLLQTAELSAEARPRGPQVKRALQQFRQGESHYRKGNYKRALRHYKRALGLVRRPSLLFNIAQCYRFLDQPEESIAHYEQYLSEWSQSQGGAKPPNYNEVKEFLAELRLKLSAQGTGGDLSETSPPGQEEATPAFAMNQLGVLHLSGLPPNALLSVNGKLTEVGPNSQLALEPGRYELLVDAPGYRSWSQVIELESGDRSGITVELEPSASKRSLFWLVAGISTTALALGSEATALVFTHKTNQEYTDTDRFNTFRSVAITGHVVAGACAIFSAVSYYLFWSSGKEARIALQPGAGSGLLSASFTF